MNLTLKDKVLKYGSYVFVLLAPIAYWSYALYPHISSKTFFIYAFVELLTCFYIFAFITDATYRPNKKNLLYFLPGFIFILWLTLAGIFGANPELSFWSSLGRGTGLLTAYHVFLFAVIISSLVQKYGKQYAYFLMEYFVIGATLGVVTVWLGPGGFGSTNISLTAGGEGGLIGNSSLAAVYMTFSLAFSLFLVFRKDTIDNKKYLHIASMAIILFSPLFINVCGLFNGYGIVGSARTSVIALPAMLGGIGILYLALSSKKNLRIIGLIGLAGAAIAFGIFWHQLITPGTSIHSKFEQVARGSRFIFWDIAGKGIAKHPLLGYGPENYSIVFQDNFNPDSLLEKNSKEGWDDRAHNVYYEAGISGGYPAILLYAVFLGSIIFAIYRAKQAGKITVLQAATLISLVAGYVFQNLFIFDSNLSLMAIFMLTGIFIGLQSESEEKTGMEIGNGSKIVFGVFLGVLFIFAFIFFVYRPAAKSALYAETFSAPINKRADMYPMLVGGSSIGEQWDVSGVAFDSYRNYVSHAVELKNDPVKLPYLVADVTALLDYLYKVADKNSMDVRLYLTISYFENTLTYLSDRPYDPKQSEKILSILEKAKTLSPNNPNIYWSIAQTKIWGNDIAGAEDAYRQAMNIAPQLPGSYTLFLKFAQVTGNKKLFDEIITKAKQNIPDFALN